jgi:hypothetical protein
MDFERVVKKRKMIREYQQDRQIPIEVINNVKHHWDKVRLKMLQF